MSNINKQALREAAEKAVSEGEGSWQAWHEAGQKYPEVFTSSGHIVATVNGAFGVSRSNFIAAANPATVLALLDELEAAERQRESWRCLAKQSIAEREKDIATLAEVRQRIAELEADRQDANTAELVTAGIITKVGE